MDKKEWPDKKSRDGQKKKRKKRKKGENSRYNQRKVKSSYFPQRKAVFYTIKKKVIKIFSFKEDCENTIKFFHEFGEELKNTKYSNVEIDSSEVEMVSPDALIYLMVMIKNYGFSNQHNFRGNLPKNKEPKQVYLECGFLDYFENNVNSSIDNPEKLRVIKGDETESDKSPIVIEFIADKQKRTIKELISVQKVFIEMMSNVVYHAYKSKDYIKNKDWYIYAEHIEDYVRVIFVDTGIGIAQTVRKKIQERLFKFMKPTDAKLMESAFEGKFNRTQTNESYRGNGLKTIRKLAQESLFVNFRVISGRGQCDIKEKYIITKDYNYNVNGTIYIFDIK